LEQFSELGITLNNWVATVEIQRAPLNFFDRELICQIADAFELLDANPECRAIVLASEGKVFCAGANFGTGKQDDSGDDSFSEEGFNTVTVNLYAEALRLFKCKKPVIAAIQGAAVGGGFGLALVADFRVAAPEARFAANFAKLGIHPGFGLTVTLPQLIGVQQANLLFYTGRRIKGEQALQIGLVDQLSSLENVRADAQALAAEIAGNAPLAVVSVRATMREGLADKIAAATAHELKEQQWLRATADADEGVRAVSERRTGNFTGT